MALKKKIKKIILLDLLSRQYDEYSQKELYSMLMCGEVKVNGETMREPRIKVRHDSEIKLSPRRWVSRGGEKLNHALNEWNISVEGKVIIDAGSSTGGFTDCLLQHGSGLVHAIDVGYNQLDYNLRKDKRVNVLERINIMSVTELDPVPDIAVADLSFRSITGAASHILNITTQNLLIALIKPQFEIHETEGFDGVIRDLDLLYDVLKSTALNLEEEGVQICAILESPIRGGKGNAEYLFQLQIAAAGAAIDNKEIVQRFINSK